MSVSDQLRALANQIENPWPAPEERSPVDTFLYARHLIADLAEAAEQVDDPVCDSVSGQARPEFCLPYLFALRDALAALREHLEEK